ncbi:short-chain alcohol dehydrogenase [Lecanora helva]
MELLRQFFFIPAPTLTERNCPDQKDRVRHEGLDSYLSADRAQGFIVTGGYAGLGLELSQILYAHNAVVYVAGRSESKAKAAISRIQNACPKSDGRIEFMNVDLGDLRSVKPAVEAFLAKEQRLHVLINNAGVMYPPQGSTDAHGNEMQMGTNCLGHYLLYRLLEPILVETASSSPPGSVRVAWAGSVAIDVQSPKPNGMELDNSGQPKDKGVQLNYGQSKIGNLFFARKFARDTPQTAVVHVCFNPGNLKTELQRHWRGTQPLIARLLVLHPAIKGAYTELWAALSPDITQERSGAYILPWGKIGGFRTDIEAALKPSSEGGTGVAARFITWCDGQIAPFT